MRVLVAQTEPWLANQIRNLLQLNGFAVEIASDGAEAQYRAQTEPYDAIVLDRDLPVKCGLTVLKALRDGGLLTPVLLLTPHDGPADFDIAPDAHMQKPLDMGELATQVQHLVARKQDSEARVYARNGLCFDSVAGKVSRAGEPVSLTAQEMTVLAYLFVNTGRLVSKGELAGHIYAGDADRQSNTIAVFVNRLRKKLGDDVIETVRGRGYVIKGSPT